MDTSKHLILNNGKNITSNVKFCTYNPDTRGYDVTFQNGKRYPYGYHSIEWIRNPEILNPALVHLTYHDKELFDIQFICVFHAKATDYWHIKFLNGSEINCAKSDLKVVCSCLSETEARNCLNYLKQLAAINELKNDDGELLLQKQYENLDFVEPDTAMAIYLNPARHKARTYNKQNLIFPFGGNASQFRAVENAMRNQISVIQGPPGTGKTQTILNIIANLLLDAKTVQIVSNNNSATENILEKLASTKYNLGFLVAPLGNSSNKELFVQSQNGNYPDLSMWRMENDKQIKLHEKIQSHIEKISDTFVKQERLAYIRHELDSLNLEITYFNQYCNETGLEYSDIKPRRSL